MINQNGLAALTMIAGCLALAGSAGCGKQGSARPDASASKSESAPPRDVPAKATSQHRPTAAEFDQKVVVPPLRPEKKDRAKPAETVAVTAEAFHQEISKDRNAAAKKFEPALVEISGVVRAVGSRGPETFVTLEAGPDALGILCVLADEKQPWAKISRGQKIKLRGLWPEVLLQPGLVACEIAELGPSAAQEVAAEALAEEFAKNAEAARKKYGDKPLILTGFKVDAKRNDLGAVRIFLKGTGEMRVDCGFNAEDRAEAEQLPFAQKLRIVGEFSALESGEMPALRGCRWIQ